MNDLYDELYLSPAAVVDELRRILAKQRRDWTARSDAMPDEAARMLALIDEADVTFASEESRRSYDEALAASRAPAPDPDRDAERQANYERFCRVAADYYDTDEHDLAEVAIVGALKNAPADGPDLRLCQLAHDVYFALGKFDPALTYLNQAIVLTPDDPALYWQKYQTAAELGRAVRDDRRGQPEALLNTLRITIRKAEDACDNPVLAQALGALAWRLFSQPDGQNQPQALELANRALGIDPGTADARRVLDEECRRAEEARKAAEAAEAARAPWRQRFREAAGTAEWVLVGKGGSRGLYVSRYILFEAPYHVSGGPTTWEHCSLRRLLNTAFYENLPASIRSRVIETTVENPDNSVHNTEGGNATTDKVFLLSLDEARRFFADDQARMATHNGQPGWWWLRSPGFYGDHAAGVLDIGLVLAYGRSVLGSGGGVRPALFLNLDA